MSRFIRVALLVFTALPLVSARSAHAKKISLSWKEIKRATEYEIDITRDGAKTLQKKTDEPSWSGDLPYGLYFYQIRAYDRLKRAGHWTSPLPLVVMPAPPKLTTPDDGDKITLYDPGAGITLKWKPVKGVSGYEIALKRDGKPIGKKTASEPRLRLNGLEPGRYSWAVTVIVKPKERVPASYEAKQWQSEPSEAYDFVVKREMLGKADPKLPLGIVQPPSNRQIRFNWSQVDGAESYEFALFAQPEGGVPFGPEPAPVSSTVVAENTVTIPVPFDGRYRWQVRALANLDEDKKPEAVSLVSDAEFRLDKNTDFFEGSGYVAFSTLLSSYDYHLLSPATNINAIAASTAATMRGSGELWFKPQWGIASAFEGTSFQIENQSYTRLGYEAVAKYRIYFGSSLSSWALIPKLGVEERDYIEVFPSTVPRATFTSSVYGLQVGFDVRKVISDNFSLGVKFAYFKPLFMSSSSASSMTGDASDRNMSLGLQGLYWLTGHWGLGAGLFLDHRSLSYQLSSSNTAAEQVTMDGNYIFASVIYKFGAVPTPPALRTPASVPGPATQESANSVQNTAAFFDGTGYVALSGLVTSYNYQLISPLSNINAVAASNASTVRGSGEYWFRPKWGMAGAVEGTSFQIENQSFTRMGYEAIAKYRITFGDGSNGWAFIPKLGIEERDYNEIIPASIAQTSFTSGVYGLQAGFDLRKALSDRFGVGLKFAYFKPVLLSSTAASSLTGDASNRNLSIGLQGLYWLTSHWGLGAGAMLDHRSISYSLKTSSGAAEQVYMDGTYLFGSLIYSFGH